MTPPRAPDRGSEPGLSSSRDHDAFPAIWVDAPTIKFRCGSLGGGLAAAMPERAK